MVEDLQPEQERSDLLDAIITGIFRAGLSLQTAIDLPPEVARRHIEAALGDLDDVVRDIRSISFALDCRRCLPLPADDR